MQDGKKFMQSSYLLGKKIVRVVKIHVPGKGTITASILEKK